MSATEPGRETQLSRSLQPRHVTMITFGGIIGAGLFVSSSAAIAATGPAIVVSYALAGALMFLVMRMLGEMATALPHIRSFTEFARAGLGDWAGFLAGWLYWYFWVIVIPVEAIAGARIVEMWFPLPQWQIGLVLMGLMTAVNLMSTRSYGEFEFWFSSIKVAAIISFMLIAAGYALGLTSGKGPTFVNLTEHGGFMPFGSVAVLAGIVTVFFSMCGSEITTIAAAESRAPEAAIAKMTTTVLFRITTFYVGSIFLILSVVPWNLVQVGESPFTLAMTEMGFNWASTVMSVIILTAVLSCLNSAFYICSRVLFVLAEKGDAPASLVQLNRRRVPVRSVLIGTVVGVIGVFAAALAPARVFALLVNSAGAIMLFVYILISISQVILRRRREREGAAAAPLTMWLFPWASYIAIAGMTAVLIAMAVTPALSRDLQLSAVTLAVVLVCYPFLKRAKLRSKESTMRVSMLFLCAALGYASIPVSAQQIPSMQAAGSPSAGCAESVYRAQDYTLGRWDVHREKQLIGTVNMEVALKGCAIVQTWDATGPNEESARGIFTYSKLQNGWLYAFSTDTANNNFFLGTVIKPGEVRYSTEVSMPGGKLRKRYWTLLLLPDGRISEKAVASDDEGKTWTTQYEFLWTRKA